MSVQYADDASKWALRQLWWSVSAATLLKRSPPNFCVPNSPRELDWTTGSLHIPGPDCNPVSTQARKSLEPTKSKETLVVASARAKGGGGGGGDLPLCGSTSLATLQTSDLRADTALPPGAPGFGTSRNL